MKEKDKILLKLVDQNDIEIGKIEKTEAHIKGLLHRAFSIFLFRKHNEKTQLLLQKRSKKKYHSGGLWTNTCCSHAKVGALLENTAKERLQEEMGIFCRLKNIGSFYYKALLENGMIEHEIDHIFVGFCNPKKIPFNTEEVEAYKWINCTDFNEQLESSPEIFTSWLPLAWEYIINYQSKNKESSIKKNLHLENLYESIR